MVVIVGVVMLEFVPGKIWSVLERCEQFRAEIFRGSVQNGGRKRRKEIVYLYPCIYPQKAFPLGYYDGTRGKGKKTRHRFAADEREKLARYFEENGFEVIDLGYGDGSLRNIMNPPYIIQD